MKNQLFYLASLLLLTIFSCTPIEENNISLDKVPFIENSTLLDNGEFRLIEKPLISGDNLIIMVEDWNESRGWINCYDKNTLELNWTWQEAQDTYAAGAIGFGSRSSIVDNVLCIAQSNLSYGIDITNGVTLWHDRAINAKSNVMNIGSTLVGNTYEISNEHESIRIASALDGQWRNIHSVEKDDSLGVHMHPPLPFEWQGKEYVTYVNSKWKAGPHLEIFWLNLYNLTDDKLEWTSDTIPTFHALSGIPGNQAAFEDGQILIGNDAIYSYNIEDGSLEWSTLYGNWNPALKAVDGVLYVNNESKFMFAVDVHTGEELFNIPSGGSASKFDYYDEKLYITSLTDQGENFMMIVNAKTGEVIHKIFPPNIGPIGVNTKWYYNEVVTVDQETGLVYTGDHRHLLVYDFN